MAGAEISSGWLYAKNVLPVALSARYSTGVATVFKQQFDQVRTTTVGELKDSWNFGIAWIRSLAPQYRKGGFRLHLPIVSQIYPVIVISLRP
jgi:hypothetical protein